MPLLTREKPAVNEAGRETARAARAEVIAGLAPERIDSLSGVFLGSFRELVKNKGHLESGERKRVDRFLDSLGKNDKKLIEEKLKDPLGGEITDHTKGITDLLGTGDRTQAKQAMAEARRLAEEDQLIAKTLGINNNPDIRRQLDAQQALIASYEQADSPGRRRLISALVRTGGALTAVTVVGGVGAAAGAAYQALSDAGNETVAPPGPPPRTRIPTTAPPPPPTATTGSTVTPEAQATTTATVASRATSTEVPASPSAVDTRTTLPPPSPSPSPVSSPAAVAGPEAEVGAVTEDTQPSEEDQANQALEEALVEIGDKNLAEFTLGKYLETFKKKGREKRKKSAAYAERVSELAVESDNIAIVVLGTDNERDRDRGAVAGRADVFKVVMINPHTFKTTTISFPRDLLAPEMLEHGFDRINTATMISRKGVNPLQVVTEMMESATGLRIDGVVQTNIDFVGGYDNYIDNKGQEQPGKNGIIDELVPEGIEVTPENDIIDPHFPKGYGTVSVKFEKGKTYRLHGRAMKPGELSLIQYARARYGPNNDDYRRSERQSEVLGLFGWAVVYKIATELKDGRTDTLDKSIKVLEEHREAGNFAQHEIGLIGMMEEILESLKKISEEPNGKAILGRLVSNSTGNIAKLGGEKVANKVKDVLETITGGAVKIPKKSSFKNIGVDSLGLGTYSGYITRLQTPIARTSKGTYIPYWSPTRAIAAEESERIATP